MVLALAFRMSGTKVLAADIKSQETASQGTPAEYMAQDRPLGCGLTFINDSIKIRKEKNNDIIFYLEGEIRNDSGQKYSSIFLFFDLYDSAGKRLDTVMATLKLDSGETGEFSAHVFVPYDQVASYIIDDIVAI